MQSFRQLFALALIVTGLHTHAAPSLPPLKDDVTRPWIGPEYWSNPLMNWKLSNGRIENIHGGWVNQVHSLTHQLKPGDGSFGMQARMGLLESSSLQTKELGFVGFKFGAVGHRNDYRANILHDLQNGFARELMKEPPVLAGLVSDGRLMVGSVFSDTNINAHQMEDAWLDLQVAFRHGEVKIRLTVSHDEQEVGALETTFKRASLTGNVALACHGLNAPLNKNRSSVDIDHPRFWFSDWDASGDKFVINPAQTFGPILWSQYTLHQDTLKLMAFFVPLDDPTRQVAELQVRSDSGWNTVATSEIDSLSRTALFRVENWDSQVDQEFRVTYRWGAAAGESVAGWSGTIRKDPVDKDTIVLAALSCSNSDLFPNRFLTDNLLAQNPDLVYFSGDQIYEANGGYGIMFAETAEDVPRATLNYLEKFWLSILGFRDLLKDRPTVMTPDDHDLYSDDLWGNGGAKLGKDRCFGGYGMHVDWVNMVEYTQMGNRPDPEDDTPVGQGLKFYTTSLDVGGVSFALINDRKFKSPPSDVIDAMEPLFIMRGERNLPLIDTINEEDFDTTTLDREGLELLGERQLEFLRNWGKNDAKLKAVLHQTAFCQPHHLMVADLDSNGWPQSGRRRALEVIREANAIMVAGDLHFASLVQHGIDDWDDAGWEFTLPSVSTNTHRAWRPKVAPQNHIAGMPDHTGRFLDGWGNKITVWAAANPRESPTEDAYRGDGEATLAYLRHTAQGYGIVRFHKSTASVTFESWPVYGKFQGVEKHPQHPGFPKTVPLL